MLKLFRIDGFSLYPLLKEGQIVLCRKIFFFDKIKINDFILFSHANYGMMIKRVKEINDKGYFLQGENAFSIDSRNFGELSRKELLYKVIYKFKDK